MHTDFTSKALGTIGQDLDLRGLKTFSIRCEDGLFVIDAGYQSPPASTPVTLHYGRKDIEQLERNAEERCDHLSATRKFIYLSEILSAIATYVADKTGHLLTLSNTASGETTPVIDIEYMTIQGDRMVEHLTAADVYALCIQSYKRRQRQATNDIRFTRFSSLQEGM
jgi:hypothetical protein